MKNGTEITSINIGKLHITSKSTLLVIILSLLFVFSFCIFCFSSCTRDIAIEYIKYKNNTIKQEK